MAPKGLPPAAKQQMIVDYLQKSRTVHTIKELEKMLPSVASINGMQVKDYLQSLTDEGKIRVEKIGSGNWYWKFASEEKSTRVALKTSLVAEVERLRPMIEHLEAQLREVTADRADDKADMRTELIEQKTILSDQILTLQKELAGYKDGDPVELDRRRQEIKSSATSAELWTDNILILENYLKEMLGGDREALVNLQQQVYGHEYVEGEGLRELQP